VVTAGALCGFDSEETAADVTTVFALGVSWTRVIVVRAWPGLAGGQFVFRLAGLTLGCLEVNVRVEGAGGALRGWVPGALVAMIPKCTIRLE
jgi:hypothetical protein